MSTPSKGGIWSVFRKPQKPKLLDGDEVLFYTPETAKLKEKPSKKLEQEQTPETAKPSKKLEQETTPETAKPSKKLEQETTPEIAKPSKKLEQEPTEEEKPTEQLKEQVDVPVNSVTEIRRSLSKSFIKGAAINELENMNHLFRVEAEELAVILSCNVLTAYFFYYLIETYSIELMQYETAESDNRKGWVKKIYAAYFKPGATLELNISYKTKQEIENNIKNKEYATCFEAAKIHISNLLIKSYNGFKQSEPYKKMIEDTEGVPNSTRKAYLKAAHYLYSLVDEITLSGPASRANEVRGIVQEFSVRVLKLKESTQYSSSRFEKKKTNA